MCSGVGDTTQLVPGSPIRTPWDHSSVDSSPRPIAASHVLHRLLMPRHPPCALTHLTTTRCSHPLCNTQHTTTPGPTTTAHGATAADDHDRSGPRTTPPRVSPQDPTACRTPPPPRRRRTTPDRATR